MRHSCQSAAVTEPLTAAKTETASAPGIRVPVRAATGSEPITPLAVGFDRAAELTGLSSFTLRRYVKRGWLRATRCGRRWIVAIAELERLVREGVPPVSQPRDRSDLRSATRPES